MCYVYRWSFWDLKKTIAFIVFYDYYIKLLYFCTPKNSIII